MCATLRRPNSIEPPTPIVTNRRRKHCVVLVAAIVWSSGDLQATNVESSAQIVTKHVEIVARLATGIVVF